MNDINRIQNRVRSGSDALPLFREVIQSITTSSLNTAGYTPSIQNFLVTKHLFIIGIYRVF